MNTKCRLLRVCFAIAFCFLLSGCGRGGKDVTTIRFASWGNEVEEQNLRALIAEFEKRHPRIKVEIEITPWARMFDKAGLAYPDWTWDRFLEVAKKLAKDINGDGSLDQWGCATSMWWEDYVWQSGGEIVSADGNKCLLDRPEAYKGLQFMSDLINRYHVAPNAQEAANLGSAKLFTTGKIGMIVYGSGPRS